jgi:hypothetical protein
MRRTRSRRVLQRCPQVCRGRPRLRSPSGTGNGRRQTAHTPIGSAFFGVLGSGDYVASLPTRGLVIETSLGDAEGSPFMRHLETFENARRYANPPCGQQSERFQRFLPLTSPTRGGHVCVRFQSSLALASASNESALASSLHRVVRMLARAPSALVPEGVLVAEVAIEMIDVGCEDATILRSAIDTPPVRLEEDAPARPPACRCIQSPSESIP